MWVVSALGNHVTKFPKAISHDKRMLNVGKELEHFFDAMGPLENKTLALLLQLPPSVQIFRGLERFRELVHELDPRFRYAVEVRHPSWFQDLSYSFFANNDICMVCSVLAELQTPPVVTTDFVYVRFIGDRSIQETNNPKVWYNKALTMRKFNDEKGAQICLDKAKEMGFRV
jgi:uncharacterized protein YecE (DUF72 family)